MLENKSTHEKKKSQLCFNVGSGCVLGGVVLLGGGLAVAGLVAAFAIIKSRNSARDDQKNEDPAAAAAIPAEGIHGVHDGTQGLGSVLENPTTPVYQNSCCTDHATPAIGVTESHMDSRKLISALNMDLGDKTVPIMDGGKEDPRRYQQEILFSDDLNKENSEPCSEILNNEETPLPAPEIIVKNDSGENLQFMENSEMNKEDEPAETENLAVEDNLPMRSEEAEEDDDDGREEHVVDKKEVSPEGEIAPKENLTMQPVEEEEEQEKGSYKEDENLPIQPVEEEEGVNKEDHDDVYDDKHANHDSSEEDVTEKEEESSEGTGSSSRESNIEAIWPTDMIEALSCELKVMNAASQNSVETMAKTECDYLKGKSENGNNNETTENAPTSNKKTPRDFVMAKVGSTHLPTREVCVWSLLALTLLLLLLHIHHKSPLQDLSYENSVTGHHREN